MTAQEYIKKYGIAKAKELVSSIVNTISIGVVVCDPCFITDEGEHISYNDLKRIIDSYELIKKDFESVEMAEYEYMVSASYNEPYWVRVKQAILDVESCK